MDEIDRKIINYLQTGFPICESPYQRVAEALGIDQTLLLSRLKAMLDDGLLSRFGPMYHAEQMGGALTLAAMQVPEQRFKEVCDLVNAYPEVAHNYRRNNQLNMWFVIATDHVNRVQELIAEIEQQTALSVYNMPKIKEYFVRLHLPA
jgi:DNA-binding Lrp family transcriptional regulator